MGNTYTWIGAAGVAAAETIAADWSPNGGPLPGDTGVLTNNGTILFGDGLFQSNTLILGTGMAVFAGDSLVTFSAPDLDAASLITTNTGSFFAQASTIEAFGNFVNEGTILADGFGGSSLTIDVSDTVFNGTTVAGYAYNPGVIQADAGNTITISVGATSELYSTGSIIADGGDVIINGISSAIVSGFAPVRGMMIIEGGGTIETNSGYASTAVGNRENIYFADATPGNTLKIDNLGSFAGNIGGFTASDTVDLGGNLGTVTTLVYNLATGFLTLESIAASTTTTLATLLIGNIGSAGFAAGTFAVDINGNADGFTIGTVINNGTTDTALTTALTSLNSSNLPGTWQSTGSWQNGVPGTSSTPIIGPGATSPFTLTTGLNPVSVAGFAIASPFATLQITSDTTATSGTMTNYNGTLDVEPGQTLTGGGLTLTEISSAITIAPTATITLSGRPGTSLAPISNVWGTTAGNPFAFTASAGTVEVDGALLAGPAPTGGGGGSVSIGADSDTSASVTVNTGGTVTDTHSILGSDPVSSGTLTLTGAGTNWTDAIDVTDSSHQTGYMLVGYDDVASNTPAPAQLAAAQVTIENNATLTDQEAAYIGDTADSAGNVTVTAGGVWNVFGTETIINNGSAVATNVNDGALYVGFDCGGTLSVLTGGNVAVGATGTFYNTSGTFTAGGIEVGDSLGSNGTLLVSGAGAQVSTLGGMQIGRIGQGLMTITNGGTVLINGGGIGVGQTAGSSGTVDVGGAGAAAALNFAAGGVTVGSAGQGTMTVSANGAITMNGTGGILVGQSSGAVGTVTINGGIITMGTSAFFNLGFGSLASGSLLVENGGSLAIAFGMNIGGNAGSSGQMTLNGGTVSFAPAASGLTVGSSGTGALAVNGGSLADGSFLTIGQNNSAHGSVALTGGALSASGITLGQNGGSAGTLTVSGGNLTTGGINIGNGGTGSLNVSDNGVVNLSSFTAIGNLFGSSGTVVIGGTAANAVINSTAGGLNVGNSGTGILTINKLGTLALSTNGIGIGQNAGANGSITVNGGLLTETVGGISVGVNAGAQGSLLVENGGTVKEAGNLSVGANANATGTVTVTGAGAVLQFGAAIGVGGFGGNSNGTLIISNGGSLQSTGTSGIVIAANADTSAAPSQMTVSGGFVTLGSTSSNGITIGGTGTGSLTVSSGGTITMPGSAGIFMGNSAAASGSLLIQSGGTVSVGSGLSMGSGTGTVTVTGGGSLLNDTGTSAVNVGGLLGGALTVSGGGSLAVSGTGGINVDSANGSASMSVAGGTVGLGASAGFFGVGNSGYGTLTVSDGGVVNINGTGLNGSGFLGIGDSGGPASGSVVVGGTKAAAVINVSGGGGIAIGGVGGAGLTVNNLGTIAMAGGTGILVGYTFPGSMTVNGGLVTETTGSINVGQSAGAQGSLLIENGGSVSIPGGLNVALAATAGGTVTVTGAGSKLTDGGTGFVTIGNGGSGALTVSNGGSFGMTGVGFLTVGSASGSTGQMLVSGGTVSLAAAVGFNLAGGSGALTINNNGQFTDGGALSVGSASGGSGAVTIHGGTLSAASIDDGQVAGATGAMTVLGTQSLLTGTGSFTVGDSGLGSLAIEANGRVTAGTNLVIANTASASGSAVNLSGTGADLAVTGTVIVGNAGAGALSMSGGATVTAAVMDVAAGATGDGAVSLTGAGTTLDVTGSLVLGDQAAGELSILGGAKMTIGAGGLVGGTGAAAAGNLDIEGAGSHLTINTGTLVVGENGPAEFTLGIGATLTGELATDQFGVTNEYGNVDPQTDPNDGTQNVGFGNSLIYDFFVANSGTIKITSGTATFYTPVVTFETNAQDSSVNGLWVIGAKDTLVMNTTSVDNSQTFDFTSPTAASLVIGQVPQGDINNLDTLNGQTTPTLTGSVAPGAANVLPGWQAPIENYQSGDVIVLQGLTYASATVTGDVVTVWSGSAGSGSVLGSLTFIDKSDSTISSAATNEAQAAQIQINALACFAAGTRIAMETGWRKVEDLAIGDAVLTHDGRCEPIVWLGSRAVDCARHPKPETVWPVRIARGAFGENVPARDLYLSPDHAVFLNDVLVPVKLLVNGTSIARVKRNRVVYHHVELPKHAVILAEGLTVESYLDTGDRTNFEGGETIRLFPDFASRFASEIATVWETNGAARLVMTGETLTAARRMVTENAFWRRSRSVTSRTG